MHWRLNNSIKNSNRKEKEIWLDYSLQDATGKWYDIEAKQVMIPSKKTIEENMEWIIPQDALTGDYTIVLGVWDNIPSHSSERLASATLWRVSESTLGRSTLQSENVILQDGNLCFKLPGETLCGAEIQTKEKVHYGSYEIRMKIPDAPSSITGFFLYEQPDYDHEIDIEIYNQSDAQLLLTTYAKGKERNSDQRTLSFDPTLDYHTYRFNYLPDRVDFFIDDVLIQAWSKGFTSKSMYLMVNTWYPKWLRNLL